MTFSHSLASAVVQLGDGRVTFLPLQGSEGGVDAGTWVLWRTKVLLRRPRPSRRNKAARLASVRDAPEMAIELTLLSGISSRSAHPAAHHRRRSMRHLHSEELKHVSGGRGGGGAGGDRGQGTSSSNSNNNNNNNNNNGPRAKNAGGGPGNSGPGDKNSTGLGGGGVGPR
jgi:hypothetical protein